MIFCAGRGETFDFARSIGVGIVESSINLTQIVLENNIDEIVFIGSAGSYGEARIFDIYESSKAANVEISSLQNLSYSPLTNIVTSSNVPRETFINSSNYITKDRECAHRFLQNGYALENMEFFGVASVGEKFGIPFKGIFVVTNYCDEDAHKSYIENYKKGLELLTQYLKTNGYIKAPKVRGLSV